MKVIRAYRKTSRIAQQWVRSCRWRGWWIWIKNCFESLPLQFSHLANRPENIYWRSVSYGRILHGVLHVGVRTIRANAREYANRRAWCVAMVLLCTVSWHIGELSALRATHLSCSVRLRTPRVDCVWGRMATDCWFFCWIILIKNTLPNSIAFRMKTRLNCSGLVMKSICNGRKPS